MSTCAKVGLAELIHPATVEDFLTNYWPGRPLHVAGADRDVTSQLGLNAMLNFPALARRWSGHALSLPKQNGDESLGEVLEIKAALERYKGGAPLFLGRADLQFAQIAGCIDALRYDLGIPAKGRFLAAFHASPGGTSTGEHFDHSASFVLQLSGTRVWTLRSNHEYPNPTDRYCLSMPRLPDDLADYASPQCSRGAAAEHLTITLNAGDLLFVPNGWWHSVRACDESLALMFIAINFTWADVIANVIREHLIRQDTWRAFAIGARQSHLGHRVQAAARAENLLKQLPLLLKGIDVDAVLRPKYSRAPHCCASLTVNRLSVETDYAAAEIEMTAVQIRVFKEIEEMVGSFTEESLRWTAKERSQVLELLHFLTSVRYLRKT